MTSIAFSSRQDQESSFPGLLLILNSAEERLQICLARDGRLLAHQDWVVPGQAMRHLAPAIDQIMGAFNASVSDLAGISCVRGPGSFTGLRLCLATVYGLAMGAGLPMAGLDYLPLLASGPASLLHGRLAVLAHARHGLVYVQLFSAPELYPLSPPQAMTVKSLGNIPDQGESPIFLLGSGVRRNMPLLAEVLPRAVILKPIWDHPQPEQLIQAAMAANFSAQPVEPLYLRGSDAEENLEAIAAKRGIHLREAQELMAEGLKETP